MFGWSFGSSGGLGGPGIFGPVVFGITAAEVLADLMVGAGPEAVEVGGHLDGSVVGSEDVEEEGASAASDPWGFVPPEEFLDAGGQGGRLTDLVLDGDPATAGDDE